MDWDRHAFGKNYMRNPEYQDHMQSHESHQRFLNWFYGVEIQGDFESAKTQVGSSAKDMNELEDDAMRLNAL